MKSFQFRSIAPKAPAAAPSPSPATLPCQPPPALPEATTPSSPKSILVPAQNYALMQIAGQDGTFSLVALPPALSSQTPQQNQPVQKNLKLPIPRYQPARGKGSAAASTVKVSSSSSMMTQTKSAAGGASTATKKLQDPKNPAEVLTPKEESPEQLILIDSAPSDISVLPESAVLYQSSQMDQKPEELEQQKLQRPLVATAISNSPVKPAEDSKAGLRLCQPKPKAQAPPPQSGIAVLSPAIFGKAVQIIPSPPNGKLPILPYSKVKSALIPAGKPNGSTPERKSGSAQSRLQKPLELKPPAAERRGQESNSGQQPAAETAPSGGALQKPPGKKRGRKRKTMEDILAFEARKKRSLLFFRKRVPEKPPPIIPGPQPKEMEISKKYRSIRPKPLLVVEAVPQLVGLPPVTADGKDPELVLGPQPPASAKAPECRPLPGPLPGSRALHRCSVCSRCFQFRHLLQSHMDSHAAGRPHVCPLCRKGYAHRGSLSTHMKLQHTEARTRLAICCQFCWKAFGYVGVYFRHLREVHRVLLTVEPSVYQNEEGDRSCSPEPPDEADPEDWEDPVELQIKCSRCQAVTPTFADMKMHLLHVHEEDLPVGHLDGQLARGGRQAERELVRLAARRRRQLKEKRGRIRCERCHQDFLTVFKLKRHVEAQHRGEVDRGPEGRLVSDATAAAEASAAAAEAAEGRDLLAAAAEGRGLLAAAAEGRGLLAAAAEGRGLLAAAAEGRGLLAAAAEGRGLLAAAAEGRGLLAAGAEGRGLLAAAAEGRGLLAAAAEGRGLLAAAVEGRGLLAAAAKGRGLLAAADGFNCVLCRRVLDTKAALMQHWSSAHSCERPGLLWEALGSYHRDLDPDRGGKADSLGPVPD